MNDWLLECVKECFNEWMNEQMKKWVSEQWTSNLLPLLHQKFPYSQRESIKNKIIKTYWMLVHSLTHQIENCQKK